MKVMGQVYSSLQGGKDLEDCKEGYEKDIKKKLFERL